MKHFALFFLTAIIGAAGATAQSWIDVTDNYIQNPAYEDNTNYGWTIEGWAGSTATRCQAQEFWNGTWNIYQSFNVTSAGKYRLSVQGYFRPGENNEYAVQAFEEGTDEISCVLYANDETTPMTSVYAHYSTSSLNGGWRYNTGGGGWNSTRHYPNSMESGREMFDRGYYTDNSVEVTLDAGANLTIGIRNDAWQSSNWVLFTNWKLEWYGTEVKVTRISLNKTSATLAYGETLQLTATTYPSNSTFRKVAFSSSDENVVTVNEDGLVTTVGEGTATITAQMAQGASTAKATCEITVKRVEVQAGDFIINEVQQANVDMFVDPSFNYGGWIELYNKTTNIISLDGLYVSDDKNDLFKQKLDYRFGVLPAGGFKCIWFDHYSRWAPNMVKFKLDADGGNIYITRADGTLVAEMQYPPAISRTSYARKTNGGSVWEYTDQPTPETTNSTSAFAATRLEAPTIDSKGGRFSKSFTTRVSIPSGATLRYTTDGSTPTLSNGQTSNNGTFNINGTTILRLRLFKDGYLSSPVVTRSYIYNDRDYTLPVLSLVSDNKNLYGADLGIFVQGSGNGRPGNGQDAYCNWNMDWDRPANIEFFTEDGNAAFNQEVGVEASGGWSRAWTPHSFNIKANKVYEGLNRMDYQFFDDKPYLRNKALKVRNGGNDTSNRIKDAAIQQVVMTSGLYVDGQCYKPVHVFHNGSYIGVLNLREPNNKHFAVSNYGLDDDLLDQFKMSPDSGYVQQAGTKDSWNELLTLSYSASDPVTYNEIQDMLDIEQYINYCAVEFYIGGTDWPQNNIKGFRSQEGGKFHFVIFDTDGAFSTSTPFTTFANKQYYDFDKLRGSDIIAIYGNRISAEIEFVTLFKNLLKNEQFKKQFADQYCIVAGSVFEPTRATEIINAMVAHVNPAMALEGASASSTANSVKNALSTTRQTNLVNEMASYLGLSSSTQLNLSSDLPEASLLINGLPVPTGCFNGRIYTPLKVESLAPAGHRFVGWKSNLTDKLTTLFDMKSSWDYYDQGSLDGENWTSPSYDAHWSSGRAPLGYFTTDANNGRGYQTMLNYGGNANSKYPTYYFRKSINLSKAPQGDDTFQMDFVADDGFVIYVNGTEAGRYLMNNSPNQTFNSFADTYAYDNPDSGSMELSASLFRKGQNTIAVEVHNNNANSTDIYWDAKLSMKQKADGEITSTEPTFEIPAGTTSLTLMAVYEPLEGKELDATDAHPIKINEISAANEIYVNDHFKKNDWIELYNTTDTDIDIAGMYLTDNLEKPTKFQIPESNGSFSTIVPAHDFLVVWADKLESKQQLHADFKLASEGGSVMLMAADESWSDTLTYCEHNGYQTVGLYPDGGSMVYLMSKPTIGADNMISGGAIVWDEPKDSNNETGINSTDTEEAGLTLSYTDDEIVLHGATQATIDIYDAAGQIVMSTTITKHRNVSINMLPSGIYLIKASNIGQQYTLKIRK